jgi:hypothetical protein
MAAALALDGQHDGTFASLELRQELTGATAKRRSDWMSFVISSIGLLLLRRLFSCYQNIERL